MKLRAKLFIATLCLILMMLAITYFLPTYLVKKDAGAISEKIYQSILESDNKELSQQKQWFVNELEQRQEKIKLLLLTVKQNPSLYKNLLFSNDISNKERWSAGAALLSSAPEVSIIQLYSPLLDQATVLFYDRAQLYSALLIENANNAIIIPEKNHLYNGYPIIDEPHAYLMRRSLLSPHEQEQITGKYKNWLLPINNKKELATTWNIKNRLLTLLAPLHAETLTVENVEEAFVPDGIFLLEKEQNGVAFLTQEAFQNTPLLNIEDTFDPSIPLEEQIALLVFGNQGHFYLTYTMAINNTYISAGISLSPLTSEFALASDKLILLNAKEHWIGFDSKGKELPQTAIFEFIQTSNFANKEGKTTINEQPFFFSKFSLDNVDNLSLYLLSPLTTGSSILEILTTLMHTLSNKILWLILFIGLLMIAISIIVIYYLTLSVVKPLENFVISTKQIAEGKFDEVHLPKLGKRKDEIALLSKAFEQMIYDMKERENIRSVLNKVLSKEIANEFLHAEMHLGGEDRIVTMLFSDIRSFTSLTENLAPQKVIKMLNLYMTKMAEVIESKQGIIDKFVGDEIMAIFGAPVFHSDHSIQAISAGYEMLTVIKELNAQLQMIGEPIFEIGIGIHTGPVVAGNMGAENRMNYTVLGKNVNLAARLCQAAKPGQLIISEYTYKAPNVENKFTAQGLEPLLLKGFREPVPIYEITGLKIKSLA